MPILTIRHVTTYHYRRPVAFGEHRMMLRPRDDGDQKVLRSGIAITPEPTCIDWTHDDFGNYVATARFSERATELRFDSTIRRRSRVRAVQCGRHRQDYAQSYPFAYSADDAHDLARYIAQPSPHPELARWAAGFLRDDGSADTHALLVGMTRAHPAHLQARSAAPERHPRPGRRHWRLRAGAAAIWRC